jgi:hypothetical protein
MPTAVHTSFDLSRQVAARLRWDRTMRVLLPVIGALAIGAGIGNYFAFERAFGSLPLAIGFAALLVAFGGLAITAPWSLYGPRAGRLETSSEGVTLLYGSGRCVTHRWSDPRLRIELWDMRPAPPGTPELPGGRLVPNEPGLPPELQILWYSPGRAFSLSPEAFDGVLGTAEAAGATVARRRINAEGHRNVERVVVSFVEK